MTVYLSRLGFCVLLFGWLETGLGPFSIAQPLPSAQTLELNQPVTRELAGGQNNAYRVAARAGQYLEAVLEQRGVDVVVTLFAPDGQRVAQFDGDSRPQGRETVAQILEATGDYRLEVAARRAEAPAGQYLLRLVALRDATAQDRAAQEATRLSAEAVRLAGTGKPNEALPLAERVLSLREEALGPQHPDVAVALDRLATLLRDRQEFARAEPLYLRALTIAEAQAPPGHPDLALILNNMGAMYMLKADWAQAEARLRRALEVWEQTLGPNHPNLARALTNLGRIYNGKGDPANAKASLGRALDIRERELGPEHPQLLGTLINLGSLAFEERDLAQAEAYYQRVVPIMEKAGRLETEAGAGIINNLAVIAANKREYAQAESLYRRAQGIYEKVYTPEHPLVADALVNLASLYLNQGQYEKAGPPAQRALEIEEKALGEEHPDTVFVLNTLVRLYTLRRELSPAIATQTRAVTISERNLVRYLGATSEREKLGFLSRLALETDRAISLHTRTAPNNEAALRLALTTVLQRKGRALDTMADDLAALRRRAAPEDRALLKQLQDARAELARLALGGAQRAPNAERQARIKQLEEQRDRLEAEASRSVAAFRPSAQPVTLDAVQAAVPAGAALVEFVAYRAFNPRYRSVEEAFDASRYAAYVVRRSGGPRWVDLGERQKIDEAVDKLRAALRDRKRRDVKVLARNVDRLVMQPLRPLLGPPSTKPRRVYLAPDGRLNLLPFATLVDGRGQYLIHSYVFSYLSSGRDLLRRSTAARGKQTALIIANPDFGEAASGRGATERILRYKSGNPGAQGGGALLAEAYFPPLPGTDGEARALNSLLPEATILSGAQATKAALKQATAPTILHVATHGFFLDDAPGDGRAPRVLREDDIPPIVNPLLRSGLALSGANRLKADAEDDGILTALEAAGLDLAGTKLVVLSACNTGVGEVKTGEGVYGLRRALVLAGSETQVLSLWPVSDLGTRDLMIEYYRRLEQGEGRTDALRQAQLKLLRRGVVRGQDFSHPYYWASFIQSGQGGSLVEQP
jgi:CHAT domain-containing protein/Tfp pilus assembly protein PilF